MRVVVLSSGGKDSAAALWWAQCQGWHIEALVTVIVTGDDSPMFQITGTHIVERQAAISGIPWIAVRTSGEMPEDMADLENALATLHIDGLVCGALRSDFQKSRIELMCDRLNIRSWTPLWHQSGYDHVKGLIEHGFEIVITAVAAEGLDVSWLGQALSLSSFDKLAQLSQRFRFHIEGEGGEYETMVVAGPHMPQRIEITTTIHWDGVRGYVEVH